MINKKILSATIVTVISCAIMIFAGRNKTTEYESAIKEETVVVEMSTYVGSQPEKIVIKTIKLEEITEEELRTVETEEVEYSTLQKKDIYSYFTAEEITYMWRAIETETYQAGFFPKCNVASAILNRIEEDGFPDNPIDVITYPNAFFYGRTNITEDTKAALEYVFQNGSTMKNAVCFHSGAKTETFCGYYYIDTDEAGHHFYGEKTNE